LILSVDLPISGFITEATPAQPYLGFKLDLDPRQLGEIITSQTSIIASKKETSVRGFFVSTADAPLLDCANMSPSSFHYHFKQVTSMSPLNYQKQLRLLEARRLMLVEQSTAANAADLVGYESPSQFSREYARMFGAPPIQDIVGMAYRR
jgi:AraC-like DNA-binding protein